MNAVAILIASVVVATMPVLLFVGRFGSRLGLVDHPNERSLHLRPTPRGGGLAIVIGTLAIPPVYGVIEGITLSGVVYRGLGCALGIAIMSLADDIRPLPALIRLGAHALLAGACLAVVTVPTVVEVPLVGVVGLGGAAVPLALVWLVGLTNAYNFMDGIDGLAGGQGVVAGLTWALLGVLGGSSTLLAVGLALATSCLVFLSRNWPPARIFMGDVGSAFVGFTLGLLTLAAPGEGLANRSLVVGALALWPFLFDASLTLASRAVRGENVLRPHRDHLYQRLVRSGVPAGRVSAAYVSLAAAGAAVGVAWWAAVLPDWVAVVGPLAGGATLLAWAYRCGLQRPDETFGEGT